MRIWVDADACPVPIKEILYRVAERRGIHTTLVANQPLRVPRCPFLHTVQVSGGFDVADNHIAAKVAAGDLVITADIPLAAEVVARDALALNPRGELYTEENIRERLAVRDMMEELRSGGMVSGGPPPLNNSDRQAFANQLDKLLTRLLRQSN